MFRTTRVLIAALAAGPLTGVAGEPARVTLEQVNASACQRDADCGTTTLDCQSGCSWKPVTLSSPLFKEFERQRLAANPCCRPNGGCPTTECEQHETVPTCVKGRCVLERWKPPPGRWHLAARAHRQCSTPEEIAQLVARERQSLAAVAGAELEVRAAPGLFVRAEADPCKPADPDKFFAAHPSAGKDVWLKAQEPQCKACGCFAPIYFCAKSDAAGDPFAKLGYAPVTP